MRLQMRSQQLRSSVVADISGYLHSRMAAAVVAAKRSRPSFSTQSWRTINYQRSLE